MKRAIRKIIPFWGLIPIMLLILGIIWHCHNHRQYSEVRSLTPTICDNFISLQEMQRVPTGLPNVVRTLTEEEILLLLAEACKESNSLEFTVIQQQMQTEGLLLSGLPSGSTTNECTIYTPIVCHDILQDIWYIAGGGSWTKKLTRKEAGICNKNDSQERIFLFFPTWEKAGTIKSDYFYYTFNQNGTVTNSYSGATDASGNWIMTSFDGNWNEEGYGCQSFAVIVELDRNFLNSSGKVYTGYIHIPAKTKILDLQNLYDSNKLTGICYFTNYPEKVSTRWSNCTEFCP